MGNTQMLVPMLIQFLGRTPESILLCVTYSHPGLTGVKKWKFLRKVFIQQFRMYVVTYVNNVNRAYYVISDNTIYVNKL